MPWNMVQIIPSHKVASRFARKGFLPSRGKASLALLILGTTLTGCSDIFFWREASPQPQTPSATVIGQRYPVAAPAYQQPTPAYQRPVAAYQPQQVSRPAIAPVTTHQAVTTNSSSHIVQKGDTIYNLSKRYGVSQAALQQANQLGNSTSIQIGQPLVIPTNSGQAAYNQASYNQASYHPSQSYPTQPYQAPQGVSPPNRAPYTSASSKMIRPIQGDIIRPYGVIIGGARNNGIGIQSYAGAPVLAAQSGQVVFVSKPTASAGSVIMVEHSNGLISIYGRVMNIAVAPGQKVQQGMPLAQVAAGPNGSAFLHFELRQGTKPIDPSLHI